MESIRYEAPASVEAAAALLGDEPNARVLSGGTDLLVRMRLGSPPPSLFVDVKRIDRLCSVDWTDQGLRIGAAVSAAEIFRNAGIQARWPGLAEATDLIGSSQIQGRATWAGNLCNASPAADSVPALIAVRARAVIAGPQGERTLAVEDVVTGPGQNALAPGELLVEFEIPEPAPRSADAYLRLIPRTEMDIAVVGAAVQMTLDDAGEVTDARVVLGAVAPTAIECPEAVSALIGSQVTDDDLARAGAAAEAAARPIDDRRGSQAYRKKIAGVLVRRAARLAHSRALR